MQRSRATLQESNPSSFATCLKAVCDAMMQGQNGASANKNKGQLGFLLSGPVQQIIGAKFAPQVTGELVELPLHQIIGLMQDDAMFRTLVNQSFETVKDACSSDGDISVVSTKESMVSVASQKPEATKAPVESWDFMWDIHPHAITQ